MTEDLDELRQQTEDTNRVTSAVQESSEPELHEQIAEQLSAVKTGEKNPSVGARSEVLSAFLYALGERSDGYEDLTSKLFKALEEDPDVDLESKSAVVELSLRLALQEAAPEYSEALSDGKAEYARQNM